MTLLLCWGVFPLLVVAACAGWGLLVERAAGRLLPRSLLGALGLAAIVVVSQALTVSDTTAELAPVLVAAGGVGGLVLGRRRLRPRRDHVWLATATLLVFAVMAAPVVSSGKATFAGYGVLGDTAVHFVIVDWLMDEGRQIALPAHSVYENTLDAYLNYGYPTGTHSALGSMRPWVGQDVAWVFAPFLAVVAALAALALAPLAATAVAGSRLRALVVLCAGVPALTFAYVQEGSIKEIATICMLALLGGLLPWFAAAPPGPRRAVPVAVAAAGALGVVSLAVLPWLGPLALVLLVVALRPPAWRPRAAATEAAAFAGLTVLLALPVLALARDFAGTVTGAVTSQVEMGNLLAPLKLRQALPVWPIADFRFAPDATSARLLIALAGAAVVVGTLAILRRPRSTWPLIAWLAASIVGWAAVTRSGSPWADAKALAIVAPAVALVAAVGAAALWEKRMRIESIVLGALLTGGIAWTLVLSGAAVPVAPRERLGDLQALGRDLAGRGPVLYPQFEEYAKHFLRRGSPDSPTEIYATRAVQPFFRAGFAGGPLGSSYDLDDLALAYVSRFRTIVLRRGMTSFPPAPYRRVRTQGQYEVWERRPGLADGRLGHLAAGGPFSPGARPDCAALAALARRALARDADARLVAALRPAAASFDPAAGTLPAGWAPRNEGGLHAGRAGSVSGTISVPGRASYDLWLRGTGDVATYASLDGGRAHEIGGEPQAPDQWMALGRVELDGGMHRITIGRRAGNSMAGSVVGAAALTATAARVRRLVTVPAARFRSLCGRSVDWVDALRG